jgi:mono/diheme cytochrome c family protein
MSVLRWVLTAALLTFGAAAQESPAVQQFDKLCAACHGSGGSGTDRGPALVNNRGLRSRPENEIRDLIRNGTSRGMPPFELPENELQSLARFIRSLNGTDDKAKSEGDAAAGERFFFGKGQCASCHMARGRGKPNGPDLSNIARQLQSSELTQSLDNPSSRIAEGWTVVVRLIQ